MRVGKSNRMSLPTTLPLFHSRPLLPYRFSVMHNLTKAQKQALREAAKLAHGRNTSMAREDRDVYYLEAVNADLPILIGGAVCDGLITLDEIGEAARELAAEFAARVAAYRGEVGQRAAEPRPPVEDPYDPNAVVSLARIVAEIDMLGNEGTLYVNRETGEVFARTEFMEDAGFDEETLESLEEDVAWVRVLSSHEINDFETMRRYTNRVAGPAASKELSEAMRGRGAYRRFRDVIHRRGLQKEWDEYREKRLADSVRFALQQHGIPFRK